MQTNRMDPAAPHPPASEVSWPELVERVVADLTNVIRAELQLFQNSLVPIFSDLSDRVVADIIAGFAILVGGIVMLAALIAFIREWLPWWQSLAIGGALAVFAGLILRWFAVPRAHHKESRDGASRTGGNNSQ